MRDILNFIDGTYTAGSLDRWFDDIDPCTGRAHARVSEASASDVDRAVSAARAALTGPWAALTRKERTDIIRAIADEIDRRASDFLEAEVADTGKPHSLASTVDIPRGAANFRIFADILANLSEHAFPMDTPDGGHALNYTSRRPKGVIGVISPWNLPLLLMTWKVAPALACGNTVVAKPSEETPSTCAMLGEVMNAVGVPPGVFNVVHGFGPGSAGEALTTHPGVDAITFTGETRTGEAIMKAAAQGTRDVSSELGGKNAGIVFADCDLDKAVAGSLRSAFTNCGQVCLCTERLYVERPIFNEFVSRMKSGAEPWRPARPPMRQQGLARSFPPTTVPRSPATLKRLAPPGPRSSLAESSRNSQETSPMVFGFDPQFGLDLLRIARLSRKKYSARSVTSHPSIARRRSSVWQTIPPMASQRRFGPRISPAHIASGLSSKRALSG